MASIQSRQWIRCSCSSGSSAEPRSRKSTQRWIGIWSVVGMRLCRLNEILYLLRINDESVAARMQNNKNSHTATITSSITSYLQGKDEGRADDRASLLAHSRPTAIRANPIRSAIKRPPGPRLPIIKSSVGCGKVNARLIFDECGEIHSVFFQTSLNCKQSFNLAPPSAEYGHASSPRFGFEVD